MSYKKFDTFNHVNIKMSNFLVFFNKRMKSMNAINIFNIFFKQQISPKP